MRVWWVERYDEPDAFGAWVRATTRGQARRQGVAELDADDITQVRAIRAPQFDGRWPITARMHVAEWGGRWECLTCCAPLGPTDIECGDAEFVVDGQAVACVPDCWARRERLAG